MAAMHPKVICQLVMLLNAKEEEEEEDAIPFVLQLSRDLV